MHLNHPETIPPPWPMEKLSSTKWVPRAKRAGGCCTRMQISSVEGREFVLYHYLSQPQSRVQLIVDTQVDLGLSFHK